MAGFQETFERIIPSFVSVLESLLDGNNEERLIDSDSPLEAKPYEEYLGEMAKIVEDDKEMILLTAFQKQILEIIEEFEDVGKADEEQKKEDNVEKITILFNKLIVLLDFALIIVKTDLIAEDETYKKVSLDLFFELLNFTFPQLGISLVNKFWKYIEMRYLFIKLDILNNGFLPRKIVFLETTNRLIQRISSDVYPELIYKIRVFQSSLLAVEDPTGLNKYYECNDRELDYNKNSRDNLYLDYYKLSQVFNNPYKYLKKESRGVLKELVDVMFRMYKHISGLNQDWAAKQPSRDNFLIKPLSNKRKEEATREFAHKQYFPNTYTNDDKFFHDQFDDYKFRQVMMSQMFILAGLYHSMISSNKVEMMDGAGCKRGTKFPIPEETPHELGMKLLKLKRDIASSYRPIDSQFCFTLQTVRDNSDTHWFQWLLVGGKDTFEAKLEQEKLKTVDEQNAEKGKFKKRYFNVYATPKLSQKMKIKRDLEKLTQRGKLDISKDEGSVNSWRYLKFKRRTNWLDLDEHNSLGKKEVEENDAEVEGTVIDHQPAAKRQKVSEE